jgi:hypothetical protein
VIFSFFGYFSLTFLGTGSTREARTTFLCWKFGVISFKGRVLEQRVVFGQRLPKIYLSLVGRGRRRRRWRGGAKSIKEDQEVSERVREGQRE